MKVRRTLSGILFGVGCALTFIGLLALILPAIANDQLKLVLASFEAPSDHPFVRLINSGMSFALGHSWPVLFVGAALLAAGLIGFLLSSQEKKRAAQYEMYRRPEPAVSEPLWEQPAAEPYRPNPFADMALWDQQFAPVKRQEPVSDNPFTAYGGPMLERNRIEDVPTYSFTPESYARPVEPSVQEPVVWQPEPEAEPEPVAAPAPESLQARPLSAAVSLFSAAVPLTPPVRSSESSLPPAPAEENPEPVYTPNEEPDAPLQISSRIRSTMGRHREW